MINTWPTTLPQKFRRDGFAQGTATDTIRSEMDRGVAKVRRRTSAAARPMSGDMVLTEAQLVTLEAFREANVAVPIYFPNPRPSGNLLVRFDGPIEWSAFGGVYWLVKLKFEIMP
jgi:hypothetical protein